MEFKFTNFESEASTSSASSVYNLYMRIPLQKITDPILTSSGINLHVLRLDMTHPHISGNKFFKLKYNLEEAKKQGKDTLLTFGGAYSNHIAATAAAGKEYGLKTIGVIRGEEFTSPSRPGGNAAGRETPLPKERGVNNTLRLAESSGMQLHFVSREEYRKKESPEFIGKLHNQFGDFYLLPEGGTNDLAVKGCAEILPLIDIPFDLVCCPVGTGGTLAGISSSLKGKQKAIGFSVLKGVDFVQTSEVWINSNYHFEGYAKHTPELLKFLDDFEKQNNIPLEQVYTGKMMFGIYDMIRKDQFPKDSTVVAIHTGGLQGKLH